MQWTTELDAVLNQCVFESGYDFAAAAALLLNRGRQLRLVSGDARIVFTSDECQVRWMEINPVEDENDEGFGDDQGDDGSFRHSLQDNDIHFYPRQSDAESDAAPALLDEPTETALQAGGAQDNEVRPVMPTVEAITDSRSPTSLDVPDGCPRLELSLSDADLDALLNSLPTANDDLTEADPKREENLDTDSASEMQWVLSFLSNPDEAAHHDVEAKNMLFRTGDRAEDDHFQYFLQQLNNANLTSPEPPVAIAGTVTPPVHVTESKSSRLHTELNEDDDSDEDWMEARKYFKTVQPSPTNTASTSRPKTGPTQSHKRRLQPNTSHMDEVLPPAAPLRFPIPAEPTALAMDDADDADDAGSDDSEDNGLNALPRYEPTSTAGLPLRMAPRDFVPPTPPSSSKLLALSQEIGQHLRKHGEFQFPRRLFRDLDNDSSAEGEREQVPQDEP